MKESLYEVITNRIIDELKSGIIPWRKPWIASGQAISHVTGKPYSLLNQMLLGHGGEYVTFKQVQDEGGRVKKGAKAQMVVFWKWIEQEDEETKEKKKIPYLRYFNVFHIDQCDGIKAKHAEPLPQAVEPDAAAEAIIADYLKRSGVKLIYEEGNRAFYRPSSDSVTLPLVDQFKNAAEYYSTVFHELTHSTGHASRLDRLSKTAYFGSEAYSKEELIAEIGAAALVNHAGLETADSFKNNAAYIQNWLQALRNDKRFIVSAAGKAEKAVDMILG
ncbi:MAG: DUF1738 domain-containing protein [Clostridia bacterium]|nr:DUF1738 domain-containing protein [Clostridia bacterium]